MGFLHGFVASLDKYDLVWVCALVIVIVWAARFRQAPVGFWDQFWQHIAVIVLLTLFLISMLVTIHLIHMKADAGSIQWAEGIVSSLLLAITSVFGIKRISDSNTNGNGKSQPPGPPASTP